MINKRKLQQRIVALEERCDLLDNRCKDLLRMVLFLAKEARVLDPGLCERSMESLGENTKNRHPAAPRRP